MKLKYRGVFYDYNPTKVALLEGKVKGKYRGVPWPEKNPQIAKTAEPSIDLKYRGVAYRKGAVKLTNIEAKPAKTSVTSPEILLEEVAFP